MAEAHEAAEVERDTALLRAARPPMAFEVRGRPVLDGAAPAEGEKVVYFVRHGEGAHNVAQREWRAARKAGEPYTVDNDPDARYGDAELTAVGEAQARALAPRFAALEDKAPDICVVSPMRRATQTALLALVAYPNLAFVAHELCHETGGRHTCDRRLPRSELARLFPRVDYALIDAEADPLWDEAHRETYESIAKRAAAFAAWLRTRPQGRIAVAAHSGFLNAFFNAILTVDDLKTRAWFATGECRALALSWRDLDQSAP